MNRLKTLVLLATLTALVLWAGQVLLGGQTGLLMALILAGVMNVGAWWWSDRLVLHMCGAHRVSEAETPDLYGIVRGLSVRAGIEARVARLLALEPDAFSARH